VPEELHSGLKPMRIYIKSNFVVPGLKDGDSVDIDRPTVTLKQFLEELERISPTPIEYVRAGAKTLNPDDWEIDLNEVPFHELREGLETLLKDGDTVTLKIVVFGGG
jgi:hypothetical protein